MRQYTQLHRSSEDMTQYLSLIPCSFVDCSFVSATLLQEQSLDSSHHSPWHHPSTELDRSYLQLWNLCLESSQNHPFDLPWNCTNPSMAPTPILQSPCLALAWFQSLQPSILKPKSFNCNRNRLITFSIIELYDAPVSTIVNIWLPFNVTCTYIKPL